MIREDLNKLVTAADLEVLYEKIRKEIRHFAEKDKPQFYTPNQFSKLTGMPYTTVIHYCKTRRLKARQDMKGGSWQIYANEIDRLKEEANINYE